MEFRKNIFLNVDCMAEMKKYPPNFFDLAIVDPPYGLERFKRGSLRFDKANKYKDGIKWDSKPAPEYFEQLFRISKNAIIWGANNFILPPSEYFLVWDKKQTVDNFASAEYAWTNCKKPAKVFEYSIHQHNQTEKIHPTEKPVLLYKWILRNYAKAGDLILDTHVGSASSLIACVELGFDYVGFEIDKEYYDLASKRLSQATRKYELF